MHPCVLCQFLTLTFLSVVIATVVCNHRISKILFAQCRSVVSLGVGGIPTLRAPPVV